MVFYGGVEDEVLCSLISQVLLVFGMQFSVSYMEYICFYVDGYFYFLEIFFCVGGVYLVEMVEYVFGINLWVEWVWLELVMV